MKHVSIINMGINNLRSVVGALNYLGFEAVITKDEQKIMNSSALILPGVGSFPVGMENLKKNNLDAIIKNFFNKGKPVLAICLGFQMLFSHGNEFGNTKGLNIIKGKVKSLKDLKTDKIIPNLGWQSLNYKKNNTNHLFSNKSWIYSSFYYFTTWYLNCIQT